MDHVCAALNYLAPGSVRNRLHVAPGDHKSVAWRAPHTSFRDEAAAGAHPRESVELRTVAYYY